MTTLFFLAAAAAFTILVNAAIKATARRRRRKRLRRYFAADYTRWKTHGCLQSRDFAHQWHQALSRMENAKSPPNP